VRDNQPREAAEMLRLAGMTAAGTGGDFLLPHAQWHVFPETSTPEEVPLTAITA
jgi:hypothetical protein